MPHRLSTWPRMFWGAAFFVWIKTGAVCAEITAGTATTEGGRETFSAQIALYLAVAAVAGGVLWNGLLHLRMRRLRIALDHEQSARQRDKAVSERSEEKLRSLFLAAPVGIGLVKDRVLMDVNERVCRITGYTLEELVGQNARMLYPTQEEYDKVGRDKYRQIDQVGVGTVETRWVRKNGTIRDVLLSSAPLDTADLAKGVSFTVLDITDRKAAENALRESERRYQTLFDKMLEAFALHEIICDEQGHPVNYRFLAVNPAFERLTGLNAEHVVGKTVLEALPGTESLWIEKYGTVAMTGKPVHFEHYSEQIGRYFEVTAYRPAAGQFACIFFDTSDSRQMREALRERKRQLQALLGNLPGMAYRCQNTPAWTMEFVSEGSYDLLGYKPDVLVGDGAIPYNDMIVPEDRTGVWEQLQEALARNERFVAEYRIRTCDGTVKWVWEQGVGVYSDTGELLALEGFIIDVTGRKQAEEALRHSEEYLSATLRSIGDGVIACTTDAHVTQLNVVAERLTGWSSAEAQGKPIEEVFRIVNAHTGKTADNPVYRSLKEGIIVGLANDTILVARDGGEYQIADSCAPIKNADGAIMGCVLVFRDVTAEYRRQQAAQLNADRTKALLQLNRMFASSTDAICTYALEAAIRLVQSHIGYMAFLNDDETVFTMYAWTQSAMAECEVTDKAKEYIVEHTGLWGEAVRQRRPIITNDYAADNPLKKGLPEGHVPLRRHLNVPIFSSDRIVLVAGVGNKADPYTDEDIQQLTLLMEGMWHILEHKHAEDALRKSENRFRELIDLAVDGILLGDSNGVITDANAYMQTLSGRSRDDLVGRNISEIFDFDSLTQTPLRYDLLEQGKIVVNERKLLRPDGMRIVIEMRTKMMPDGTYQSIMHDITNRKEAEQICETLVKELRNKNEELESIMFIASHDLRSPLVNIRGFSGELEKDIERTKDIIGRVDMSVEQRRELSALLEHDIPESLSFIKNGNKKVDTLLNGLLRLSRIGTARIEPTVINMNTLVGDIIGSLRFKMREHRIDIAIEGTLPDCRGDVTLINQVFANLIDNAVKYRDPTRPCRIRIRGRRQDDRNVYEVEDNGIGIDNEHKHKIFDVFCQLNTACDGDGLGLTIVRRVLDRQDGVIDIASKPGSGTVFTVTLPSP